MLAEKLVEACRALGHHTEFVRVPLNPSEPRDVARAMDFCLGEAPARWIAEPDVVLALRFPAYLVPHPRKRVWLLHQLRQYYEFYAETRAAGDAAGHDALRERLVREDSAALGGGATVYALSRRVASRLAANNGVAPPPPLYAPVPDERFLYASGQERFVFAPSRLEAHKRQWLLIEAMRHVKSDVIAVIGGEGGAYADCAGRVERHGLGDRVLLAGQLSRERQAAWYANCLAVFFGPVDEDYGFVTLEAMASAKPVITCRDSGGTLEFVDDGATGAVVEPDPLAIAQCIDGLAARPARAREMGAAGLERFRRLDLTWHRMAETLLGDGRMA